MTKSVPPEMVALVRRLYADGVAVAAIEAEAGVNTDPVSLRRRPVSALSFGARGEPRVRRL